MTMTEKVERAFIETDDDFHVKHGTLQVGVERRAKLIEAAIAVVIEEAAKVVDDYASVISDWEKYQPNNSNTHGLTVADVAISIRALAEDKP